MYINKSVVLHTY